MGPFRIHIAKWLVPVTSPPIENGAVAVFGNVIVSLGPKEQILAGHMGEIVDHGEVILAPSLVNAHSHLELSPLKWRLSPAGNFVQWVRALVEARNRLDSEDWTHAITAARKEMIKNGTKVVGDVGNQDLVPLMAAETEEWGLSGYFFHEMLCPLERDAKDMGARLADSREEFIINNLYTPLRRELASEQEGFRYALSAHAPHTVAPSLIQSVVEWNRRNNAPFSIHVAESPEEMEFYKTGDGPMKALFEERGYWPLDHTISAGSPIGQLDSLGVLGPDTICVHCVHVDPHDLDIIAARGASICLCPRSNIFLGVGTANPEKMVKRGINICIGTDSLASNDKLSIFSEMDSLRQACRLDPGEIFHAATMGGATALGVDKWFGSLEPGKSGDFLAIKTGAQSPRDLYSALIHLSRDPGAEVYWAQEMVQGS